MKKRLVHSTESSLDENNYDCLPSQRKERIEVKYGTENSRESIIWTNEEVIHVGRRNSAHVITNIPGPKPRYRNLTKIEDVWSELIDDSIIGTIVSSTNKRIAESIAKMSDVRKNCDKITYLYETNEMELKAFIGL